MNPFELPPSTPPVRFDPPQERRRRRTMVGVALASAGLVVGGVAVVGSLASADQPEIAAAPETTAPDTTTPDTTTPDTTTPDSATTDTATPDVFDGKVVIDLGEGDPIEIDLGNLPDLEELQECLGLPALGEFPPLSDEFEFPKIFDGVFGQGHVVVVGPDGVSVVDFGEGDGSVTITKDGDEITVESEGDVTVDEPPQLPALDIPDLNLPDPDKIEDCVDGSR